MKNILGIGALVIIAAAIGAIAALQPWAKQPAPPPAINQPVAVVEPAPPKPAEPAPAPAEEIKAESGIGDSDSKRLALAVDILKNLNSKMSTLEERMAVIEQDVEGARLNQQQQSEQQLQEEIARPEPDSAEAEAARLAQKAAQEAYFVDLESSIVSNYDEGFTQEVSTTFADFLSSGEPWTEGVAVTTTECGGDYCKISIQHPQDMDATAQFELDGRIYLEAGKQFGQSLTKERRLENGDKEITVYFAKSGAKLPEKL